MTSGFTKNLWHIDYYCTYAELSNYCTFLGIVDCTLYGELNYDTTTIIIIHLATLVLCITALVGGFSPAHMSANGVAAKQLQPANEIVSHGWCVDSTRLGH